MKPVLHVVCLKNVPAFRGAGCEEIDTGLLQSMGRSMRPIACAARTFIILREQVFVVHLRLATSAGEDLQLGVLLHSKGCRSNGGDRLFVLIVLMLMAAFDIPAAQRHAVDTRE